MTTLFFYGKPFVLTGKKEDAPSLPEAPGKLKLIREPDAASLESLIDSAQREAAPGYLLMTADEQALLAALQRIYRPLDAAGGLVTNPAGEVLLIFRRRKWDLPKGKVDEGETPEQAALREVREETGLSRIRIEAPLVHTWHGYREKTDQILKQTYWYRMSFTGKELTVPQIEEDITDIQWIRPENIARYLPYSYPNLWSVFRAAGYAV